MEAVTRIIVNVECNRRFVIIWQLMKEQLPAFMVAEREGDWLCIKIVTLWKSDGNECSNNNWSRSRLWLYGKNIGLTIQHHTQWHCLFFVYLLSILFISSIYLEWHTILSFWNLKLPMNQSPELINIYIRLWYYHKERERVICIKHYLLRNDAFLLYTQGG